MKYSGCVPDEWKLLILGRRFRTDGLFDLRSFFHGVSSSLAHTVGLQPTFHPDKAAFWLPDFSKFHGATAPREGKRVVTETGFDALAPFQRRDEL